LGSTDQWNQTYTLTPVIDSGELRRLRVLYQYVTHQLSPGPQTEIFEASYRLIEVGSSGPSNTATTTTLTITVDGKPVSVTQSTQPPPDKNRITYVRRAIIPNSDGTIGGFTWVIAKPDTTFVEQPGCILCDYGTPSVMSDTEKKATGDAEIIGARNVHKLLKNVKLRDDWLYLPGTEIPQDAVPIPAGIGTQLYVKREIDGTEGEGLKSFYEFALFNLDAASVGTGSSASGGQSEGRVTTPLERVSVPVGGAGSTLPQ
jgi:hypothetical protein